MSKELPISSILGGRYRIDRVIGCGGFGITYYATHISLGRACAIKEFFISGKCNRQSDGLHVVFENMSQEAFSHYKTRFLQEAQTLTRIDNPHVVHVRDVFEENGTAYIVMDFIQGITLQQKISQSGALPYEEAVNYIAQLSEAVATCHDQHILHRDIKPDNVMITPENMAMLIDFGSARTFVNNAIQDHTAILTMGYAPIEQYTNGTKKGNYTDIYALGGVFYFALTGQKPVDAAERVINDQLVPPQELNPSVPDSANYTIMKALSLQPEDRYQTIAEFQDDLVNWQYEGDAQSDNPDNKSKDVNIVNYDDNNTNNGTSFIKKKTPKWPLILLVSVVLITIAFTFVWYYITNSYVYISETNVEVDADGGEQTISVSSNREWSISQYGASWVHEHRQGDYLIVDVDENTTYEPRETTIWVECLNDGHYTTIKQEAAPQFGISPTNVSIPGSGGTQHFTITGRETWRIKTDTYSWGHLTRNGNSLTLRVDPNPNSSSRTDYFVIINQSGEEKKVNITQQGCVVSASIKRVWVDYNVYSGSKKGMKIHINFDVNGMLNRTGQAAVYFYNSNGNALRDTNGSYKTFDGNVATHVDFTPGYTNCNYGDLQIFMPYDELHLSRSCSCYFTISIWNGSTQLTSGGRTNFDMTY